jgi:N6-adenosine-specific RNA methylase IME4
MSEQEKSPARKSRAVKVSTDQTINSSSPSATQASSIISVPRKKYGVIYVDPPGSFRNWSANGTGRNAIFHYDCSTFEELAALPIPDHAANDSTLFLGAAPLVDKAFELIRAWDFEYKTFGYFWFNQSIRGETFFTGPVGFWMKASPEPCFLATRGKPKRWARDVPSLVIAPRISPREAAGMP